jgi:hypothetical protein
LADGEPGKQIVRVVDHQIRRPVLTRRGARHHPAVLLRQHAHAVANPKQRHAEPREPRIRQRRVVLIHTRRPAGEHDPLRLHRLDALQRQVERMQLAVHARLADAAGDELRVL